MTSSLSSRQRHPSNPSTLSLNRALSIKSKNQLPPPISTVITSPPWARDEPPSPNDAASLTDHPHATDSRPSDVASYRSNASELASRWWSFTLPRNREPLIDGYTPSPSRRGLKDWLPTPSNMLDSTPFRKERDKDLESHQMQQNSEWDSRIPLPTPVAAAYTFGHNSNPGWEVPWSGSTTVPDHNRMSSYGLEHGPPDDHALEADKGLGVWARRKRKLRNFILINTYVPLLFRFLNITFTTAALVIAIRIRQLEIKFDVMGAVGSSPIVVIIFAPLTLVHVMAAIYLEYFGRPLGLWRTSAKLFHTLSEVLFICAWSAALSLCFDNFFTSVVPCASPSSTAWYNHLPRPPSSFPTFEGSIGDRICEDQLALICLVGVGLLIYCTNLVISLFRIFEKVKYHPPTPLRSG